MQHAVGKRSDLWVVSVNGLDQICCGQKRKAVEIVRHATILLVKKKAPGTSRIYEIRRIRAA
jgi:hypothetical protein